MRKVSGIGNLVSEHTVHFSRVAVGNLHPTHQRSKAPISPWLVLHFWFGHFFPHGPFARWEARLLWSADLPFQVASVQFLLGCGKQALAILRVGQQVLNVDQRQPGFDWARVLDPHFPLRRRVTLKAQREARSRRAREF